MNVKMNLTKEQLEAGLRACNHFSEAYPEENTPELYEFIKQIEDLKNTSYRCQLCQDTGWTRHISESDKMTTQYISKCECN